MSRHTLDIATGHLVLGWDPPLQTFFLQVYGRRRVSPRIWHGGRWREIATASALLCIAAPHLVGTIWEAADNADRLRRTLEADQRMDVA